jgi:hypothetical protein
LSAPQLFNVILLCRGFKTKSGAQLQSDSSVLTLPGSQQNKGSVTEKVQQSQNQG